jgi:nucleoside-diphosphate-sugar epimerase
MRRVHRLANHVLNDSPISASRAVTQEMLRKRVNHGVALEEFRRTRERSIHNFSECASPPPSRVVVTGGTGCIGTAMLRHLQAAGVEHLTSISRRLPAPERRIRHVDYRTADIRDISRMQTTLQLKNPELVIHLAGQRQPALAERRVAETLSSNIFGTMSVLAAAGEAGVPRVVTASTGKALRFFASEVYTASKKLAEYLVSQGPARWGTSCATVRFTHVVDNSLVYQRIHRWARGGEPIRLHAPGIAFYAQSAREAAQLLMASSAPQTASPTIAAIRDIGWPHDLLELALDVIEEADSDSAILFSGYEPGYVDQIFPGTFDPLLGDHSPLFNVLETGSGVVSAGSVETLELSVSRDSHVDEALAELESVWRNGGGLCRLREQLQQASIELLKRTFADASAGDLLHIWSKAQHTAGGTLEHQIIGRHLEAAVESATSTRVAS